MSVRIFANLKDPVSENNSTRYLLENLGGYDLRVTFKADPTVVQEGEIVFLRQDIPIDRAFLEALPEGTYVNDPHAIIDYHTKEHLLLFPDLTVPTIITNDRSDLERFVEEQGNVVLKPLDENSGNGIVRIGSAPGVDELLAEYLGSKGTAVAQRYIEGVETLGDKRINVVDYEPVSAALRLPKEGSFICNMGSGGSALRADVTREDHELVERIAPWLRSIGARWAGIDRIGPYLGEINVASPGMLYEADRLNGNDRGLRSIKTLIEKLS